MLEDEVAHLREQLRETVDENGRLYKLLKERDFEIKHLKKKIEEDRFAFTGSHSMAVKIHPPTPEVPVAGPAATVEHPWAGQTAGGRGQVLERECQGPAAVRLVQMRAGNKAASEGREQAAGASVPGNGSARTAGTVSRLSGSANGPSRTHNRCSP